MKDDGKRVRVADNLFRRGDNSYFLIANVRGQQHVEALKSKTRAEAETEKNRRLAELRDGSRPVVKREHKNVTLDELEVAWAEYVSGPSGKIRQRTIDLRRTLYRKHLKPALGRKKVRQISVTDVRHLIDRLNRQGLSGSSVRGVVYTLNTILSYGARFGYVERSVVSDLVKDDLPSAKRETEPRYLETEEVDRFFAALGPEFRVIAQTLFWAALRVGECLALTWDCIDLKAGLIEVRQGKTQASIAKVPILPPLREILQAHRAKQIESGLPVLGEALVFCTCTGRPQGRRNVLRAFYCASDKAGLTVTQVRARDRKEIEVRVSPHDLRHSAATLAYDRGLELRDVSELLRHASTAVTQTVYIGRIGKEDERKVALGQRLAAVMGGAS